MKKKRISTFTAGFCPSLVLLIVVGALLGITIPAAAQVVTFPDPKMEGAVRYNLGIPAPTPITNADMETMVSFRNEFMDEFGNSRFAYNIQGIEYATNLKWLGLDFACHNNGLPDLSLVSGLTNLAGLNMTGPYNSDHPIDLSLLPGTNMTSLSLWDNYVTSLSPISGWTNMERLTIVGGHITDISAVSGLTNMIEIQLSANPITDISPISGLENLAFFDIGGSHITTLDLRGSNLAQISSFYADHCPVKDVLLSDATLSQSVFNVVMDGVVDCYDIAESVGVLNIDMSRVDFAAISDVSEMYTMDDLEKLLLAGATNLDGSRVVALTNELDSLNWLDVTGLWDTFDASTKNSLNAWDAKSGHTLITPEPTTLGLLAVGGLALLRRRSR